MVKYTQGFLKKLEDLLKENNYDVRYERGNFKSGYCILEEKKVVVINKFSTLESRIQALTEIIYALSETGEITADLRQAGLKNKIRSTAQNTEPDQLSAEFPADENLNPEPSEPTEQN